MKVRVFPKIRYFDSKEAEANFISRPQTKKYLLAKENLIKQKPKYPKELEQRYLYSFDKFQELERISNKYWKDLREWGVKMTDLEKSYGQVFNREEFCEVNFEWFCNASHLGDLIDNGEIKDGYIEGEIDNLNDLYFVDYQYYDEQWKSRS